MRSYKINTLQFQYARPQGSFLFQNRGMWHIWNDTAKKNTKSLQKQAKNPEALHWASGIHNGITLALRSWHRIASLIGHFHLMPKAFLHGQFSGLHICNILRFLLILSYIIHISYSGFGGPHWRDTKHAILLLPLGDLWNFDANLKEPLIIASFIFTKPLPHVQWYQIMRQA